MNMKSLTTILSSLLLLICFSNCEQKTKTDLTEKNEFGNFKSQLKWGEHLVTIADCNACHTPKKMTDQGPVPDASLLLSGHPAQMPRIDIDRKEIESKGLVVAMDLTEWVGPWGVSFAANLTPDATGLGSWTEEQFFIAIRQGKFKGLPDSRSLLPPMPWDMYRNMTDGELKAIFAYLKSIKPISNIVPMALPPTSTP